VRSRQKADNGPVLAEHVISALLLLAGSDAKTVMPSGSDSVRAEIDREIQDLRDELRDHYVESDPLLVMARLDELVRARGSEADPKWDFAALQAEAEKWMAENPSEGNTITPKAMLLATRDKADDMLFEAINLVEDEEDGATAVDVGATVVDVGATVVDVQPDYHDYNQTVIDSVPIGDDDATVVDDGDTRGTYPSVSSADDATVIDAGPDDTEGYVPLVSPADERPPAEEENGFGKLREAEEAARLRAEEAERREAEEAAKHEAELEAVRQQVLQNAVMEAQRQVLQDMEQEQRKKAQGKKSSGKAAGSFIGFVITMIIAWFAYLYIEATYIVGATPWWMKIALFVVYLIALIASVRRIDSMRNNPNFAASQTTMMRIRVIGTAGMIYFRLFLLSTIFPAVLILILYLAANGPTPFWYHFLSVYVFCWGVSMINFAFQSNVSALSVGHLSWDQLKQKKAALAGSMVTAMLMIPAIVVFLHWHFGWFPMKTWVIIVLIIYMVLMLINVVTVAKGNPNELQND